MRSAPPKLPDPPTLPTPIDELKTLALSRQEINNYIGRPKMVHRFQFLRRLRAYVQKVFRALASW